MKRISMKHLGATLISATLALGALTTTTLADSMNTWKPKWTETGELV